ncbi:MAG: SDR family oxidoreductase [Deltaproteobacteria bacterium]|nr:SDR family oxidoreductase [Deltaproteobacteria bacterium]
MELGLKGKRAVVTGGNRGIGRACALELAREGARVCVTARNEELLQSVVEELNHAGGEGRFVSADLVSPDECRKVVETAVAEFGGVDILINSAGAAGAGDVLDLDIDLLKDALDLKTYGYMRMIQLVIPHMKKSRWGRIVNIAGGAGASPGRGNLPTSFANITVLNATRAFSDAVSGDGILINTICPGFTNTQRARTLMQKRAATEGIDVEEALKDLGRTLPAGRIAEPEEIGRVACFLSSEANSYMFGSSLYMDGGHRRGTP